MDIETLEKFVGRRVRNLKPGGHFGWEGTLKIVGGSTGQVQWDNGGGYSYPAREFLHQYIKGAPFTSADVINGGYIMILDADDAKVEGGYLTWSNNILGNHKTYDEAVTAATAMVSGPNSESVTILRAVAIVELADPPVRVREL